MSTPPSILALQPPVYTSNPNPNNDFPSSTYINSAPPAYDATVPRPNIEILVSDFKQEVILQEIAKLFTVEDEDFIFNATATYNVSLQDWLNIFKFRADDYVQLDVQHANGNLTDLLFSCINPSSVNDIDFSKKTLVILNPVTTVNVAGQTLPDSQKTVPQDYYRYLGKKIFGVVQGVDMIANENEIMDDLETQISGAWNTGILTTILSRQTGAPLNNETVRGAKDCACQYFFYELMTKDPERFALSKSADSVNGTETGLLNPTDGVASIPFAAGDMISFPITIKTHANQKSYVDGNSIADRTYKIKLVLTEPTV